ncbi:two-component regulator propeller domain-containing protein [Prevotella sp. KH2C16]|uniref:type IX secretion system anionic LPS delivery protein PorZ n=1 Tax=Prevotella sp. KH2C16 TaxID=1855325 RepID=UPI0008EED979|nr:two-component regulator propeller domain-containing protein [Prevotella sp. KH2C16]SFF84094.1 Two component regulator propeller [Prevotella sp. KH2C16]
MKKILLSIILIINTLSASATAIGTWKAYMAYQDITEIEKGGNTMYVLASSNLYSYHENDQSIQTYDKINFLSDSEITHIAWCQSAKRLVIVYQNQNIDLLDQEDKVTNISEFYSKPMTEDKTIYSIDIDGQYAYISTGFGILKLNVSNAEISDTYNLGFRIDYSYTDGGYLYAASSTNGLYRGNQNTNLLDRNNWSRVGNYIAKTKDIDAEMLKVVKNLNPGGPKYNYFGFMKFANNRLYTCGGGYYVTSDLNRPGCIQVLSDNDEWTIYEDNLRQKTGVSYVDLSCLDVNPKNENHVFASGRTGVYEFMDGKFVKLWNSENSPLESAIATADKEYILVLGLGFDKAGSLWCLNSQAPQQSLLEYTNEGKWISHTKDALMKLGGKSLGKLTNIFHDSRGLIWFGNDHWTVPSLYAYQSSSDRLNAYTTFTNQDGQSVGVSSVQCIAEDKNHNIWIGTSVGPLMLEPSEITSDNYQFQQIKVPRNDGTNFADYLLDGVNISAIVIDEVGRKWFGTKGNGIYLISADNMTQIQHFTTENSRILSNNIESMAINPKTGELFIGTDKGLCSYMTDASVTNENMTTENVYAYPNPVRPEYTGPITIVGLSYDADVKIVTSNGVLVNEGRSSGGTYTWNGCDQKGKRVASGVYMVQTATQTGDKGTVCKVAIVN